MPNQGPLDRSTGGRVLHRNQTFTAKCSMVLNVQMYTYNDHLSLHHLYAEHPPFFFSFSFSFLGDVRLSDSGHSISQLTKSQSTDVMPD